MIKEGFIIERKQINIPCCILSSIGNCTIEDCLKCENEDYRIIDKEGKILKDFHGHYLDKKNIKSESYVIQFFDKVDFDNLDSYLENPNSDYRITRCSDLTVMRSSHMDEKVELEALHKMVKSKKYPNEK